MEPARPRVSAARTIISRALHLIICSLSIVRVSILRTYMRMCCNPRSPAAPPSYPPARSKPNGVGTGGSRFPPSAASQPTKHQSLLPGRGRWPPSLGATVQPLFITRPLPTPSRAHTHTHLPKTIHSTSAEKRRRCHQSSHVPPCLVPPSDRCMKSMPRSPHLAYSAPKRDAIAWVLIFCAVNAQKSRDATNGC
ncbi:hypothetical protein B0T16DRAFT_243776 [Cercophora newfieldiana]|uniref:Uncharacterized protein n=1 Tax=Cercophora newfieldiana TaxID=92897 RepID=A0AA40CJJ0_9PEZI|nr:hypothetical protein B0T16DRAFT_243776 [Cercophora newfieldiana]